MRFYKCFDYLHDISNKLNNTLYTAIALFPYTFLHMDRAIEELTEVMIRSLSRAVASKPSLQPAVEKALEV